MNGDEKLPEGWIKVKSKTRPNKEYFYNSKLKISLWRIEDLQKLQKTLASKQNDHKTAAHSSIKSSASTPSKSAGLSSQSKAIKKNVARDRMVKLQNVLADEVKRDLHKSIKSKEKPHFKQVAVEKKNVASKKLKELNESLIEELKQSKQSRHTPKVPKKLIENQDKKEIKEKATETFFLENDPDVDMVDISLPVQNNELPDEYEQMDWEDVPEQEVINQVQKIRKAEKISQSSSQDDSKKIHFEDHEFLIIVDTNVLLSNIEFLKEIKGKVFKDIGKATIFLPYIVLCELDKLKTHNNNVAMLARRSITFIDDCFKKKDSYLIGQSAVESIKKQIISIDSGDDEILNCCLQIQENTKKIILLTNDKNLRNKAFVNKIEAYTRDMLNFIDYNIKNEIKFD